MTKLQALTNGLSALCSYLFRRQQIIIDRIPPGKIIDIGGGGEGVIAQIGAEKVTAVDKLESEIKEAQSKAPTATWQVADAQNLPYENESFDNATAFFSLMYMNSSVKEKVIAEVFRVLPPGGEFWIWDANIPTKEMFTIMMIIKIPNGKTIKTGYGSKASSQSMESISEMLKKVGFDIGEPSTSKLWFFLKAYKPIKAKFSSQPIL